MQRARLSKQQRLRSPRDFARVRQWGRSFATGQLALSIARQPTDQLPDSAQLTAPARVGFSVGRRVGSAVVRNRVRRRLRELMRSRLGCMAPGWDVVLTARAPAGASTYTALDLELDGLLARAKVLAPGSEARHI
jgi:ribonuclease P protein component